jgi:hypothetical protein
VRDGSADKETVSETNMNKWAIPALLIAFILAGGADKAKKDKPAKDKPAKKASNDAIRTQQKTADAFAEKKTKPATTQPSEAKPSDDQQAALKAIDEKVIAENDRFDALLTQLNEDEQSAVQAGKEKDAAKVRKKNEKERATHNKVLASLNKQREELSKPKDDGGAAADEKPKPDRKKIKS